MTTTQLIATVSPDGSVNRAAQRRRRRRALVTATQIGLVVVALAAWQIGADAGFINTFFFSSPVEIWEKLVRWAVDGTLLSNTLVSLYEAFLGFIISVVLAIPIGMFLARSTFWDAVTRPFIDMANATPRFALAPLFVIMFGLGSTMKIALVFTVVFFIVLINTIAGVKAVEEDFVRLGRISGASRGALFMKVIIPAAGGYILAGLRLAVPYALAAAVVGEMLSGSSGLGYLVANQSGLLILSGVYAAVLVLALLGWALNSLVNFAVSKTPWAHSVSRSSN
jgi:NitT/TauT family transport system permease protein